MQNDRMAADMAVELRKENVTCVSLWPGAVMTENISEIISHPKDEKVAHKSIKVLKIRARTFTISAVTLVHIQYQRPLDRNMGTRLSTSMTFKF